MYLLGYDIGSSFVKASLLDAQTGRLVASATAPEKEMAITAVKPGWAEQDPELWWKQVTAATKKIRAQAGPLADDIAAIGISYQMHGLVITDKQQKVLRPSIIWCDSRAVGIGEQAEKKIGKTLCRKRFCNSPGNFTASKLRWIMENEPKLFGKIDRIMLPGDYIAMRMTGDILTTTSGLSEGIFWDYKKEGLAAIVLEHYGIPPEIIPPALPSFSFQGTLTQKAARELNLKKGIVVSYRAGDQPNNALSLNVLHPGELAATTGTSGVIYGVVDSPVSDKASRVNTFIHVNCSPSLPRYGVLLCINGTGILNRWLRENITGGKNDFLTYEQMNRLAANVPVGSDGLTVLPYGNGAERTLGNRDIGASLHGWMFNCHNRSHLFRASQEGIAFALNYGVKIMNEMGISVKTVRAGEANLFLSPVFAGIFATVLNVKLELYRTDGAQGAARGAGIGAGIYRDFPEAFAGLKASRVIYPDRKNAAAYREGYEKWRAILENILRRK